MIRAIAFLSTSLMLGWASGASLAQELEPRRWTHLPIDTNFIGGGYAKTSADIFFDPVLRIEDATLDMRTTAFRYIRTFRAFDRSARFEFEQAWKDGTWSGLLDGTPATVNRTGWDDARLRLAVNLFGGPPLAGKDFAAYRSQRYVETLVAAALSIQLPTGQYYEDKLLNLGTNRFTFRPQLGLVHNRERWSFETTASVWLFTDNSSFFDGRTLKQDPLYTIQGSAVYTMPSGLWLSGGAAYGYGGESTLDGVSKEDDQKNVVWSLSGGYPVKRNLSLKVGYVGAQTNTLLGADSETFSIGFTTTW